MIINSMKKILSLYQTEHFFRPIKGRNSGKVKVYVSITKLLYFCNKVSFKKAKKRLARFLLFKHFMNKIYKVRKKMWEEKQKKQSFL